MNWLLRLYPREWRRHYGGEIEEVLASQPKSLQLVVDLLGGAVDAHWNPQAFARRLDEKTTESSGGTDMVNRLYDYGNVDCVTTKDGFVAGVVTIGTALVVAAIIMVSESPNIILLTMSPGFLTIGTQWIALRGHSWRAKFVLLVAPLVVLYLIGLVASIVAGSL